MGIQLLVIDKVDVLVQWMKVKPVYNCVIFVTT